MAFIICSCFCLYSVYGSDGFAVSGKLLGSDSRFTQGYISWCTIWMVILSSCITDALYRVPCSHYMTHIIWLISNKKSPLDTVSFPLNVCKTCTWQRFWCFLVQYLLQFSLDGQHHLSKATMLPSDFIVKSTVQSNITWYFENCLSIYENEYQTITKIVIKVPHVTHWWLTDDSLV